MTPKQIKEFLKDKLVEDGDVMGSVRTNMVGSDCTFAVIAVDQLEHYSTDEVDTILNEALWESGMIDYGFASNDED